MFGWEFPPHISGGLGTACFGLSMGLIKEQVRLLLVVPRAYGDELIPLISASDIVIGEQATSVSTLNQEKMEVSKTDYHSSDIETI